MPDAARQHYAAQQRLQTAAVALSRSAWAAMDVDFDGSWAAQGPRIELAATSAQLGAVRSAEPYLTAVLAELDLDDAPEGRVDPAGFVGQAGDGRPVTTLLYGAVTTAKQAVGRGLSPVGALAQGGRFLDMAVQTLVADTGRGAVSTGMAARRSVTGWVRMLQLPSCARCALLAGKFFRWNDGFQRHPRCDCVHIPASEAVAGDLTTDPRAAITAGQVRGLTEAETRAIVEDGADVSQVVNARRGMSVAQIAGRQVQVTTEGTTVRGVAGRQLAADGAGLARAAGERYRRAQVPRLTPESIYALADDRAHAVRLLRRNGYLTD